MNVYRLLLLAACTWPATGWAQQFRVQFPPAPEANALAQGAVTQPAPPQMLPSDNNMVPVQPAPGATIQPPSFDPFSTQQGPQPAPSVQPNYGSPYYAYPPPDPSATFPGGLAWSPSWRPQQYLKVCDDLRFRHTWIAGDAGRELDINDTEIALTLNLPNFLHSGQPLHVSPGFIFHWWQGPTAPFSPPTELPPRAYSAYLEFDWRSNPQNQFGVEADLLAGVFSDFENTTASIRFIGTGLGWWRLANNFAIKGGVTYLDRVDKKLFPAGGIFWQPNEFWNVELYFPNPRIERYLWMLGNTHIWLYVGGEYGGGSWSIEHDDGRASPDDRIDINDLRAFVGLNWFRDRNAGIRGFVEVGYVFDRELVFRFNPAEDLKLKDSIMLRTGITF